MRLCMKKRVISIVFTLTTILVFVLGACVSIYGNENGAEQVSMTLDEYLETGGQAWFLTGKREYPVQAMMVSEEKSFHNDYENNDFTVTDDGETVVLKGPHNEVWRSALPNVIRTYTKPDGSIITEDDFSEKDVLIDLVSIPSSDSYFAMFVPADISVAVETAWGGVLKTNVKESSHGDGDYLVCRADENGNPDLSDVWVLNGVLFPEKYDTVHRNADNFQEISQEQAKQMMEQDDGHVIVDVRRQDEYDTGHIPGAILIPNESIGTEQPAQLPDLDQIILIYCRSGNRSKQAARKLFEMGYTNIYEFGGINTWTGEIVTDDHE